MSANQDVIIEAFEKLADALRLLGISVSDVSLAVSFDAYKAIQFECERAAAKHNFHEYNFDPKADCVSINGILIRQRRDEN